MLYSMCSGLLRRSVYSWYIITFFVLVFASRISLAFVVLFDKNVSSKFKIKSFIGQENVIVIQRSLE